MNIHHQGLVDIDLLGQSDKTGATERQGIHGDPPQLRPKSDVSLKHSGRTRTKRAINSNKLVN